MTHYKSEEWKIKAICPECNQIVTMTVHCTGHERDSSGDYHRCDSCDEYFPTGLTGQYIEEID
jgi:hypothetical protein